LFAVLDQEVQDLGDIFVPTLGRLFAEEVVEGGVGQLVES
jgi:hypothetical protein